MSSGATIAAFERAANATSDALANQIAAERAVIVKTGQDLLAAQTLVARGDLKGVAAGIGFEALAAQRRAVGEA